MAQAHFADEQRKAGASYSARPIACTQYGKLARIPLEDTSLGRLWKTTDKHMLVVMLAQTSWAVEQSVKESVNVFQTFAKNVDATQSIICDPQFATNFDRFTRLRMWR